MRYSGPWIIWAWCGKGYGWLDIESYDDRLTAIDQAKHLRESMAQPHRVLPEGYGEPKWQPERGQTGGVTVKIPHPRISDAFMWMET